MTRTKSSTTRSIITRNITITTIISMANKAVVEANMAHYSDVKVPSMQHLLLI